MRSEGQIIERIRAATTMVMHLTHQQEKGLTLADKMIVLLDAAQAFLLREFKEDEAMQEAPR